MILVLVGTSDYNFKRLLDAVKREVDNGNIKDKVIMQAGCNKIESDKIEVFDLIEKEKLDKLVKEADVIITHGGVGSILQALEYKKPVIAAAREKKYEEAANDHQHQIIDEFVERGFILKLDDFDKLDEVLNKAKTFKPKQYKSNNKNFVKVLDNYIKETDNISWYNKYRNIMYYGFPGIILSILNIIIYNLLNFNYMYNTLISFGITFIIALFINKLIDVKINKNYLITKVLHITMDALFMYILVDKLSMNNSKIYTNIIICLIIFIIIKLRGKK